MEKKVFLNERRKNKLVISMLFAISLVFLGMGCGGGDGGGGEQISDPPSISNLTYSPTSASLNGGGGTVTVNGSFDFDDEGGNLSTLTIAVFNPVGDEVSRDSNPITGVEGVKAGRIDGSLIVPTTTLGNFSFQLYVTDALGDKSNILTGSFSIKDVWMTKAPMPTGREFLAADVVDGKIYAIGGSDQSGNFNFR